MNDGERRVHEQVIRVVCPIDHEPLNEEASALHCRNGHVFRIVQGVPILLRSDVHSTIPVMDSSLQSDYTDPLMLDTVAISTDQRAAVRATPRNRGVDPVVAMLVAATGGRAYRHLVGRLVSYPIPEIDLPPGNGRALLDVGCSWGRWSIAAARKGYRVLGIDPSIGALLAAKRVASQLGVTIDVVCADARYLPFEDGTFDTVYSYSVLQHFAKDDACRAFQEIRRVMASAGECRIQLAHARGVMSLAHRLRRGLREARGFEVRYWSLREIESAFAELFPRCAITPHCFFGLGLEACDRDLLRPAGRLALYASESMKRARLLHRFADSIYIDAWTTAAPPGSRQRRGGGWGDR